jgi:hypothetical protein
MNKNMAKEKKETTPKTPEHVTSNVRSYFTKEVNEQIVEMSGKEMENVMKEMINTRQWIALLKYTSLRTPLLDSALRTTDPIKDPYTIAWSQGAMAGLCDIETYVIDLNAPKSAAEEPNQDELIDTKPEGVIMG